VLLLLVKQIVKDAAQSMLKDLVLSTLNGMGCKGIAIANALQALDLRKGAGGGAGGMMGLLGGGVPKMPGGAAVPGMPPGHGDARPCPGMACRRCRQASRFRDAGVCPDGLPGMDLGAAGSEEMMARMRVADARRRPDCRGHRRRPRAARADDAGDEPAALAAGDAGGDGRDGRDRLPAEGDAGRAQECMVLAADRGAGARHGHGHAQADAAAAAPGARQLHALSPGPSRTSSSPRSRRR
jgi:hypothetical protein